MNTEPKHYSTFRERNYSEWAERPIPSRCPEDNDFTGFYSAGNEFLASPGYTDPMQDEDLAYTPHPAARRTSRMASVSGAARRENRSNGLAVMAVSALTLAGSAAMLSGSVGVGAASIAAVSTQSDAAPAFERRAAAPAGAAAEPAPVRPADQPAPVEMRTSSPLPFAGDALGPNLAPEPAAFGGAGREQHALTSFDGNRTLTDGPTIVAAGPSPSSFPDPSARPTAFPYAPVVWNNPIKWIGVHKEGL